MKASKILCSILLVALFSFQAVSSQDQPFLARVRALEGKTTPARGKVILNTLKKLNVKFKWRELFQGPYGQGCNIITTFGQGEKQILVGAHYDVVAGSPGANDNGSGVSVALALVEKLKDAELKSTVKVIFFDGEEQGLAGSRAYVSKHRNDKIFAYLNLDVCGTGDTIVFGPAYGGEANPALQAVRRVVKEKNIPYAESTLLPPSDNRSFQAAGIPNIAIAIVPRRDAVLLSQMMKGEPIIIEEVPQVLKVMHTPEDKSTLLTEEAMERVFEVVYGALLYLDSQTEKAEAPSATEKGIKRELAVR